MMRDGRVVAAGPIPLTLTAENLSATFGLPLVLEQHGERYTARASPDLGEGAGCHPTALAARWGTEAQSKSSHE